MEGIETEEACTLVLLSIGQYERRLRVDLPF